MGTIKPFGNRMLVGAFFMPERRQGGVVVPDKSRWQNENDRVFWVIAVGKKCKHCKVGDRVVCVLEHNNVEPIVGDPENRGFISENQVIGFLTETP